MATTNFPNGLSVENGAHLSADASIAVKTSSAFAGGTTNAHGDSAGTGNPYNLFTVTGVVELRIFGVCSVELTGASATLEVGVAGATANLIAQTTGTNIDANEIWNSATPGTRVMAVSGSFWVADATIIETVGTADVTAGQITYYCVWRPISDGATVVAA